MKKVLITGANSYIGNSFADWVEKQNAVCSPEEKLEPEKVSLRGLEWTKQDWSGYDAVLHVAGLAHADVGHTDETTRQKYYSVNRDLTIAAASKAKREGVRQFIYMSSIIIYGDSAPIGQEKVITADTQPSPAGFYGDSKLQAELGILPLQDENFQVVVIRTPMVYGESSKGNFPKLVKMAEKISIFPMINNYRSMIYIRNLCELLRLVIVHDRKGIFYPQNREQISTSQLVYLIGNALGKKIHLIKGLSGALKLAGLLTGYIGKIFGSLTYEQKMSEQSMNYCRYSVEESVCETIRTEKRLKNDAK